MMFYLESEIMSDLIWFDDVQGDLVKNTGGKGASLSKMYKFQLNVPNGFIVSAPFFFEYRKKNNLDEKIVKLIEAINFDDFSSIEQVSKKIRDMIIDTPMPDELEEKILTCFEKLGGDTQPMAVRSSSTAEDLDDASFAGQLETFLYVVGKEDLIEKIRECWVSLYNGRAVFYRKQKGFDERNVSIAVVVQKMVNSEKAGVMFTANPINKNRDQALIESAWGLGEAVVSGTVTPDNNVVDKITFKVIEEYISEKETMFVRDGSLKGVVEKEVPEEIRCARVLTEDELLELVKLSIKLEKFFGKPEDVEWAIEEGKLYLLQSRPITTL
jgi:pyruvate,water dikinase